ncbi:hypothetical protein L1887_38797 [Cichorium endivia]|nr:hypothetical protein L1887_38797 [Cichorium endivia]
MAKANQNNNLRGGTIQETSYKTTAAAEDESKRLIDVVIAKLTEKEAEEKLKAKTEAQRLKLQEIKVKVEVEAKATANAKAIELSLRRTISSKERYS